MPPTTRTAVGAADDGDDDSPIGPIQQAMHDLPLAQPILLTLNCSWVRPDFRPADPLHKAFGFQFQRIDLEVGPHGYTSLLDTATKSLAFAAQRDMHERITRQLPDGGLHYFEGLVRVVVILPNLVKMEGEALREALQPLFTNAQFFSADSNLERIWLDSCPDCGNKMKPAGLAYVCEHCGHWQNRPVEPPLTADQPEGEDPLQGNLSSPRYDDAIQGILERHIPGTSLSSNASVMRDTDELNFGSPETEDPPSEKVCGRCGRDMKRLRNRYVCPGCGSEEPVTCPDTVVE